MKKILLIMLVCLLALAGCKDEKDEPTPDKNAIESFTVNGVSFNMVKLKGGSLTMNMELPLTPTVVLYQDSTLDVTLADYSIGQTEVTQALWLAVMGENPSYFSSNNDKRVFEDDFNRPVENVWWDDCQEFIEKLNKLTGRHFRIPSEAEWQFAARGGMKTHGYPYAGSDNIDEVAWWLENSDGMTHPVGHKKANELGLYDMSGNVMELCYMPLSGYSFRVYRGGSYFSKYFMWKSVYSSDQGEVRGSDIGLRLAE